MASLGKLKSKLTKGKVYRRAALKPYTKSLDRHLEALVSEGALVKLAPGLYYYPVDSVFGQTPAEEETLIKSFLKDNRFLVTSPNMYNSLGVGTTQLYNIRIVYNHKRHGRFTLGNRTFDFKMTPYFPTKLSEEFLVVDLVNNLKILAEDQDEVLKKVLVKVKGMDKKKVRKALKKYGKVKTKKLLDPMLEI